jgi:hypothetical protein
VSIERTLASLLELHLGPSQTLQTWSQAQIDADQGAFLSGVSQRLSSLAVLEIAPAELREKYWDEAILANSGPMTPRTRRARSGEARRRNGAARNS